MFKLKKYLKNYKKELILGPIFKLVEAIFELIVPLVMAKIIDVGIKSQDVNYILKMGGVMVILGAVGLCSALTCQFLASRASQGFGTDVRNDLFRHINTLSHAEIDEIGTSSMITRITNDVNQLQTAVAMLIRLVIRAPFLVIGATVMSFFLDVKLSLIFLFIIPLVAVVLYQIMTKSIPFYRVIQKKLDKISLITGENLKGARVIRSFSKQDAENERFLAASNDHMQTSISVGKISALLNPLTYLIMNFAILAIIWFGGMRVDGGAMTQGEIIAFVNYMSQILLALVVVANLVVTFTKAA
ncbi:MAG: ABC transporter permease, partial [Oscillospiraceae bacterium]